ncbi:MAG: RNA 2',3'-cyclic phosphodiesterase [Balneolaceae bacterium]|nr:RNA 2',3'-cyclic phosphodiesterase [Balneolaceae bacterium]
MSPVRSFFALALPEDARRRLGELQRGLPSAEMRLEDPARMHLTLRFLGECHAALLDRLVDELSGRPFPSFSFRLRGTGAFPDLRRPRVIWAGVEPSDALLRLQEELEILCRQNGLKAETREFIPHVTLGRSDGSSGDDLYRWFARHREWEGGSVTVDGYGLYESTLEGGERKHRVRSRLPLTGGEGRRQGE